MPCVDRSRRPPARALTQHQPPRQHQTGHEAGRACQRGLCRPPLEPLPPTASTGNTGRLAASPHRAAGAARAIPIDASKIMAADPGRLAATQIAALDVPATLAARVRIPSAGMDARTTMLMPPRSASPRSPPPGSGNDWRREPDRPCSERPCPVRRAASSPLQRRIRGEPQEGHVITGRTYGQK